MSCFSGLFHTSFCVLCADPLPTTEMYSGRQPGAPCMLKDFKSRTHRGNSDLEGYHRNVLRHALSSSNTSGKLDHTLVSGQNFDWNHDMYATV
jgi:hypothetical protein